MTCPRSKRYKGGSPSSRKPAVIPVLSAAQYSLALMLSAWYAFSKDVVRKKEGKKGIYDGKGGWKEDRSKKRWGVIFN